MNTIEKCIEYLKGESIFVTVKDDKLEIKAASLFHFEIDIPDEDLFINSVLDAIRFKYYEELSHINFLVKDIRRISKNQPLFIDEVIPYDVRKEL